MTHPTIIVPVDGASNIKLEVLDYETLETVSSAVTDSPSVQHEDLDYNETGREFGWFDSIIQGLPEEQRSAEVIAPVARGASGGLIGSDNSLMEVPGQGLTLAYTHGYSDAVNDRFAELAGDKEEFFLETGSIRDLPGSLTLLKRFVFEEMVRPELLQSATGFAHYGALMGGHYLGGDYLAAIRQAGNEHSYWMCHSGTRDVRQAPGTPSQAAAVIESFQRLVPAETSVCFQPLGDMPAEQAEQLNLPKPPKVIPGGHDTCLSHIPIQSTFYQAFPSAVGKPILQVEAGTWTMIAQMGGMPQLPGDGFTRDIIIQGTVDGEPVVTGRYGGGADFAHLSQLAKTQGQGFDKNWNEASLLAFLQKGACFVLPNCNPSNHGTGPFPTVEGRVINDGVFFADGLTAFLSGNLATIFATAQQVTSVSPGSDVPVVLTAGGSKDPLFSRTLATLLGRPVYAMFDKNGQAVTETTTLGAAIIGKAACLGVHPYEIDTEKLGMQYRAVEPFTDDLARALAGYREQWLRQVGVK